MLGSFQNQQLGALTSGQAAPQLGADPLQQAQLPRTPAPFGKPLPVSAVQASGQRQADSIAQSNRRIDQYNLYAQQKRARAVEATGQVGGNTGIRPRSNAGFAQQAAPKDMVPVGNGQYLARNAAAALGQMNAAMSQAIGRTVNVNEGWRSLGRQQQLYALYKAGKGNLAAVPGTSVHGTGRAADLAVGSTNSAQFRWLVKNAYRFGWSWTGRTFSQVEPWHWEYVGN